VDGVAEGGLDLVVRDVPQHRGDRAAAIAQHEPEVLRAVALATPLELTHQQHRDDGLPIFELPYPHGGEDRYPGGQVRLGAHMHRTPHQRDRS
jgi:hypothetical protein